MKQSIDRRAFIRTNMRLVPVPFIPEISIYTAHPGSGLRRLLKADADVADPTPYWAYPWGGGTALARYVLDNPETVEGKSVVDLGAGSGLVAIAAAKAGAGAVYAAEIDRNGLAALSLNAEANGVEITPLAGDLTAGELPDIDIVLVGDLFYAPELAARVIPFLDRCLAAGSAVLIGDPYRAHLPHDRLKLLADYQVPDVGGVRDAAVTRSGVFAFEA